MRLLRFLYNNNDNNNNDDDIIKPERKEYKRLTSKNNKMYEMLENDTIEIEGKTLYRIRSLINFTVSNGFTNYNITKGQLGGYIESEKNLDYLFEKNSPYNCFSWIDERACVLGEIEIKENTLIQGDVKIGLNKGIGPIIKSCIDGIENIVIKGKCGIIESNIGGHNILIENNCEFLGTSIYSKEVGSIKLSNVCLLGDYSKYRMINIKQYSNKLLELKDTKIKASIKEVYLCKYNNIENFYQFKINNVSIFFSFNKNPIVFSILNNPVFYYSFECNKIYEIGSIKDFLRMMTKISITEKISLLELGLKYNELIYYCIEVSNENLSKILLNDELLSLMKIFDVEQNLSEEKNLLINKYMKECEIELEKIIKKIDYIK